MADTILAMRLPMVARRSSIAPSLRCRDGRSSSGLPVRQRIMVGMLKRFDRRLAAGGVNILRGLFGQRRQLVDPVQTAFGTGGAGRHNALRLIEAADRELNVAALVVDVGERCAAFGAVEPRRD